MFDDGETSRLLDILGNRNRRRIIDLLRQKPCFVTEISDKLMVSPKAVIEHLQMMEEEQILSSFHDNRRRKYYSLTREICIDIRYGGEDTAQAVLPGGSREEKYLAALSMLARMLRTRDTLIANLEEIERDIDARMDEVVRYSQDLLSSETEMDLVLALAHCTLSLRDLEDYTGLEAGPVEQMLQDLMVKGIVEQNGNQYMLRGPYAEQPL
ncbi:transcriptional regulator, ArsR family [Methanofollis liminatans DSM 4140]|uniref:Transcriptional regulator, ArsR family n=1 Tax=Methanofollis liminatans DSM 4140 TaxID=28892 RepID=J1APJ7_9EURY|nr:ArsR family transcriptional regulator [Methanofollis liminatans]EJG06818.1 transcriptional regulator, ArsR family [Methanofollis liminatans DSM 4140]